VESIRNQFILVVVCAFVRPGEEATVAAVGKIENAVEIETAPTNLPTTMTIGIAVLGSGIFAEERKSRDCTED